MTRHLCLDGPLNGRYAEAEEAEAHGYVLGPWTPGHSELVLHSIPPSGETSEVSLQHLPPLPTPTSY